MKPAELKKRFRQTSNCFTPVSKSGQLSPQQPFTAVDFDTENFFDIGFGGKPFGFTGNGSNDADIQFFANFPHNVFIRQLQNIKAEFLCNVLFGFAEAHVLGTLHSGHQIARRSKTLHTGSVRVGNRHTDRVTGANLYTVNARNFHHRLVGAGDGINRRRFQHRDSADAHSHIHVDRNRRFDDGSFCKCHCARQIPSE